MRKQLWRAVYLTASIILGPVLFSLLLLFTLGGERAYDLSFVVLWWILAWLGGLNFLSHWIGRVVSENEKFTNNGVRQSAEELMYLTESRREIVAAFEIERRRIERDLHDGAQQYLVRASMDVGEIDLILDSPGPWEEKLPDVRRLLNKAQNDAEAALRSLRATVAGIHPKVLSDLGLEEAVRSLCADSPVNVKLRVPYPLPDMPEGVIAAAYFLVSEALTNVAKYAPDARTTVLLSTDDELHVSIVDDGPGGAVIKQDHGLAGLRERLAVFGGTIDVSSPEGGPTIVKATIPLLLRLGEFSVSFGRKEDK